MVGTVDPGAVETLCHYRRVLATLLYRWRPGDMVPKRCRKWAAPCAISQGGTMKARVAIVSSTALLGLAAFASPAAAAPPGAGLDTFPATCGGAAVTVTAGNGDGLRSGLAISTTF
jgi:hypothetical protein